MVLAEAYFDESESRSAGVFGVAGYAFKKDAAVALSVEWMKVLRDYGLTHFHMVDCAHGAGEFRRLSKEQRIEAQTRLFGVLKEHMALGICVTFDTALSPDIRSASLHGVGGLDPYTLCSYVALDRAAKWAVAEDANMAYVFEAGSANQVKSNALMAGLFIRPAVKDRLHYVSHSFIGKTDAVGIQCADILAWQCVKDRKNSAEGRPRRRDFNSLLEKDHVAVHLGVEQVRALLPVLAKIEAQRASLAPA